MSQRPFSDLTRHFTAEDWAVVDAETERIRMELDQPVPEEEPAAAGGRTHETAVEARRAQLRPASAAAERTR